MKTIKYECPVCHKHISEPYNDDIAQAELKRDFPHDHGRSDVVFVCDTCYKEIKERLGVTSGNTLQ